jgi:hypothetical protein
MIIFESILTTFVASIVLEAAGAVAKNGSSRQPFNFDLFVKM